MALATGACVYIIVAHDMRAKYDHSVNNGPEEIFRFSNAVVFANRFDSSVLYGE